MTDEDDLYAIALGEDYFSGGAPSTTSTSTVKADSETSSPLTASSCIPPVDIDLFRKLLIGARSQIEKLKNENKTLKSNLENAIASGGVVICPNCTHHFKDRLCPLKPRAMRRMRARNCVEIEFDCLEDLDTWLHLNQLETNNDGMPTIMHVKKVSNTVERSLKSVGSLLPALVEKKNDLNERKHEKSVNSNANRIERHRSENTDRKDSNNTRKHESATRDKKEESLRKNSSRRSESPDVHKGKRRKSHESERREREIRRKEENLRKPSEREVSKRKLSLPGSEDQEKKIAKKSITERIQFLQAENDDKKQLSFTEKRSTNSSKEENGTSSHSSDISLSTNHPSTTSNPSIKEKPKRAPIVWNNTRQESSKEQEDILSTIESNTTNNKPFEFKLRTIEAKSEKKLATVPNLITSIKDKTTSCNSESKSKYTFVPTSKKSGAEKPVFIEPATSTSSILATDSLTQSARKETKIISEPPIEVDSISNKDSTGTAAEMNLVQQNDNDIKDLPILITKEVQWKKCVVKKTTAVLNHIYKRGNERLSFTPNWSNKMIVLNGDVPQAEKPLPVIEHRITDPSSSESASVVKSSTWKTVSENDEIEPNLIANSLKQIGVSEEGIALLKSLKMNKNVTEKTYQDEKITEQFNDINSSEATKKANSELNLLPESSQLIKEPVPVVEENETDIFEEFFPDLANLRSQHASDTNTETSSRPISTESFGSMADREEDELTVLIREDSAVPPGGDMNLESMEPDQTVVQRVEYDDGEDPSSSDWAQFCLEDIEDDVDETTREQRFVEMEKSENKNMEWDEQIDLLENDIDDPDSHIQTLEPEETEDEISDEVLVRRTDSVPLEMKSDFRLSDDDDLISPMTSTPNPDETSDDVSEPPEDETKHVIRDDSYVDELDWNFDEDEDSRGFPTDNTVIELKSVGGTNHIDNIAETNSLEDGELSEEEERNEKFEDEKKETKKSIRERIQFSVDEEQVTTTDQTDSERRRDRHSRPDNRRTSSYSSSNQRRSTEENRERSYKRDTRPASYRSLLQRRNS